MTDNVSPETVERMIALVRCLADVPRGGEITKRSDQLNAFATEARGIDAQLPAPVDPDEQAALDIIEGYESDLYPSADDAIRAAIKRGRTLAIQEAIDPDEQYARDLIKSQGWSGEPSIGGEAVVLMIATAHRDSRTLATQGDR